SAYYRDTPSIEHPKRFWPPTVHLDDMVTKPRWLRDVFDPLLFHYWATTCINPSFQKGWNARCGIRRKEFKPLQLETCIFEELHDGFHATKDLDCVSNAA